MSEHVYADREQQARISDGHHIARRNTPDAPAVSPFASVDLSRLPVRPEMFLVDDPDTAPGQMAKHDFLTQLRADIIEAVDQELAGTGWTAEGCPWLEYCARRTAGDGEAALRKSRPALRALLPRATTSSRSSRACSVRSQTLFLKVANCRGKPIVVADPSGVRVFLPDGRVLSPPNVSSLVWPPATSDDKDKQ